jgi:16S rRNA (uracil1498-N3)-methyltransferase
MTVTLLVDPAGWDGAQVEVAGDAYRHLFRARRLAAGERLRVVDGRGRARWGTVAAVERDRAIVALGESAESREPAVEVELLVATLRPERASWLVEKATEVGVAGVRFLHTERAPRTFGAGAMERLRRVAAAAVEQCGRARCPEVTGVHEWKELAALTAGIEHRLVLDTAAGNVEGQRPSSETAATIAVLVGPEGGFSDAERQELVEAGWSPVGLGSRILRTETAAVVGAAWVVGIAGAGGPFSEEQRGESSCRSTTAGG